MIVLLVYSYYTDRSPSSCLQSFSSSFVRPAANFQFLEGAVGVTSSEVAYGPYYIPLSNINSFSVLLNPPSLSEYKQKPFSVIITSDCLLLGAIQISDLFYLSNVYFPYMVAASKMFSFANVVVPMERTTLLTVRN